MRHRVRADMLVQIGLAISIAALLAGLYGATLAHLIVEWSSSPDASYGLVLVAIAIVVAWKRRAAFVREAERDGAPGAAIAISSFGALLYLVGLFGADVFLTRISFVVLLTGILWFLSGGRAVRIVAAPLAMLLIAIPLPELVVNAITLPMQLVASRIAEAALGIAGVPVYRDGNILALPSTSLQVAEACSGLRSLLSLTAIGAVIAWTTERAAGRRLALIAACVPIAVIMNALRIAATGIACEAWGPSAASEPWHSLSGWLTFVLSVVVLIGCRQVATRMRWTRPAFSARPASV